MLDKNKISILIPTRKRPQNVERILNELQSPLNEGKIEIILGIDLDDDSYNLEFLSTKKNVTVVRTPATKYLSNIYNILVNYSNCSVIGFFADDVSFIDLSGFDDVLQFFNQNTKFLYSFNRDDLTTHGFVSMESIQAIGALFPPYLEHGFCDRYLEKLYGETGRKFVNGKNFYSHLRPLLPWDEVYQIKSKDRDQFGRTCDDRDSIIYEEYIRRYMGIQKEIILK